MCNYPKFPCMICAKNVSENVKAVQCHLCERWVHIKCNNLNNIDYSYLRNNNESWYCIDCCSTIFPFNSMSSNKNFLACCTNTDNNTTWWIDLENNRNSSLSLKPSLNIKLLVNQFNNATPENNNDPEKICSSKYYDIEEMGNIEIPHKNNSLSLLHINACSLNKNFNDLKHVLSCRTLAEQRNNAGTRNTSGIAGTRRNTGITTKYRNNGITQKLELEDKHGIFHYLQFSLAHKVIRVWNR